MLEMPELKAVIFDMDGVLVDTEPLHYRIDREVLQDMGFELPYDYYKQFIGSTNSHLWNTIIRDYGLCLTPEELNERACEKKDQILAKEGYPRIPGAKEFVESLKRTGWKLAVASSSTPDMIAKMTAGVEVDCYFDAFVSGEDVGHPKPAPDIFLRAAEKLGVSAQECLVIEDSENGTKAAAAAGIACLGFLNPNSGEQNLRAAAYLFEAYEGIDPSYLRMVHARYHRIPLTIAQTERLVIRELRKEDYGALHELCREADIAKRISSEQMTGQNGQELLDTYIAHNYPFFGYGYWALVEKDSGRVIGIAGVTNDEPDLKNDRQGISFGYAITKEKRRQGFAYEACAAILTYLKESMGISDLYCVVEKDNKASAALAEKLGFVRNSEERERWIYGRYF